jgi:hypothetical protein
MEKFTAKAALNHITKIFQRQKKLVLPQIVIQKDAENAPTILSYQVKLRKETEIALTPPIVLMQMDLQLVS